MTMTVTCVRVCVQGAKCLVASDCASGVCATVPHARRALRGFEDEIEDESEDGSESEDFELRCVPV